METNPFDSIAIVMMERASELMSELHHRDNNPAFVIAKIGELKAQIDHIAKALHEDWKTRGLKVPGDWNP